MSSPSKRVFLLGRDISRSISPYVQNAAFRKLGINAKYELKELNRKGLGEFISHLSEFQYILGFNVTSPFKEEAIKYISSNDFRSKSIGAVNTVKITKTKGMQGFNTDYDGIIASLKRLGVCQALGRKALLLGPAELLELAFRLFSIADTQM